MVGGGLYIAVAPITTVVAAAAVVPDSSTSTKALCSTDVICTPPKGFIPVKSAAFEKAIPSPSDDNGVLRLAPKPYLNFGSFNY